MNRCSNQEEHLCRLLPYTTSPIVWCHVRVLRSSAHFCKSLVWRHPAHTYNKVTSVTEALHVLSCILDQHFISLLPVGQHVCIYERRLRLEKERERERAMFRLRFAVFLTLCVSLSSSQINTCSQDFSNVQCRSRCAAAASTNVRCREGATTHW